MPLKRSMRLEHQFEGLWEELVEYCILNTSLVLLYVSSLSIYLSYELMHKLSFRYVILCKAAYTKLKENSSVTSKQCESDNVMY